MGKLYTKINDHIAHCDAGHILEIGMDRGEGSTKHFIQLAKQRGVRYVGVDMDTAQTRKYKDHAEHCEVHQQSGESYLDKTQHSFSIVYLDNFDWNYWKDEKSGPIPNQNKRYEEFMQTKLTNVNSQQSHLLQAIKLQSHLTPNATIMCDDTWWEENYMVWMGKCSAAIPYLLSCGFRVSHSEGKANNPASCVILTRTCG